MTHAFPTSLGLADSHRASSLIGHYDRGVAGIATSPSRISPHSHPGIKLAKRRSFSTRLTFPRPINRSPRRTNTSPYSITPWLETTSRMRNPHLGSLEIALPLSSAGNGTCVSSPDLWLANSRTSFPKPPIFCSAKRVFIASLPQHHRCQDHFQP